MNTQQLFALLPQVMPLLSSTTQSKIQAALPLLK